MRKQVGQHESVKHDARGIARVALGVVAASFLFGFAMVPLYRIACEQVLGIKLSKGAVSADEASSMQVDPSRTVVVEFMTSVNSKLPWAFKAEKTRVEVHPGELTEVWFDATNQSAQAIVGNAVPSVAPSAASAFFNKTECFCFTEQVLAGGETRRMPVLVHRRSTTAARHAHADVILHVLCKRAGLQESGPRESVCRRDCKELTLSLYPGFEIMAQTQGAYYVPHGSHWPIVGSIGLFSTVISAANWFNDGSGLTAKPLMFVGLAILVFMIFGWFGTVIPDPNKKENDWPAVRGTWQSLLDLPLDAYKEHRNKVREGYERAAKFLRQQQIFRVLDLPYQTQLVPLAAIFAEIGERAEHATNIDKIARWYWCGVFGELYGSAVESRFAKDILEVPTWLDGGSEPSTVADGVMRADRLLTMRSRLSAAYKGFQALLLRQGAIDFRSGKAFDHTVFFDEGVDIHHIFPKSGPARRSGRPRRRS